MEELKFIIGRKEIKLGDDPKVAARFKGMQYATILSDAKEGITIIELPIAAFSRIEFNGNTYGDIEELYSSLGIKPNQTVFSCGEGEDRELVTSDNIDFSICPFDSENVHQCEYYCHKIDIYRDDGTLGFDMAQVKYNHGPTCCVVAKPGYAWRTEK